MPEQPEKGPYKFEIHDGAVYEIDGRKVVGGDALTIYGPRISIGPFKDAPEASKILKALNVAYGCGWEDSAANPAAGRPQWSGSVSVNGAPLGEPADVSINIRGGE